LGRGLREGVREERKGKMIFMVLGASKGHEGLFRI